MATYQSPLTAIVKGALAGAAGTAAMGAFMERAPQALERMGWSIPSGPKGPTAPDTPTEEVAERVVEGLAHENLPEDAKAQAGQTVHWTYGSAWGAFFGVVQASLKLPHLLHGVLFGVLVGTVADTVMPRFGLQVAPQDKPVGLTAFQMAAHVVYGVVTAGVWAILNLGRRG